MRMALFYSFANLFNVWLNKLIKYSCKICHKEKLHDPLRGIKGYLTYFHEPKSNSLRKWCINQDLNRSRRQPGKEQSIGGIETWKEFDDFGWWKIGHCWLCWMRRLEAQGEARERSWGQVRLEREAGVRVMQGFGVHVDKCEET